MITRSTLVLNWSAFSAHQLIRDPPVFKFTFSNRHVSYYRHWTLTYLQEASFSLSLKHIIGRVEYQLRSGYIKSLNYLSQLDPGYDVACPSYLNLPLRMPSKLNLQIEAILFSLVHFTHFLSLLLISETFPVFPHVEQFFRWLWASAVLFYCPFFNTKFDALARCGWKLSSQSLSRFPKLADYCIKVERLIQKGSSILISQCRITGPIWFNCQLYM